MIRIRKSYDIRTAATATDCVLQITDTCAQFDKTETPVAILSKKT